MTENGCCCCKLGWFCLATIDHDQHLDLVGLFVVDCNCWLIWVGSWIGELLVELIFSYWLNFYWLTGLFLLVEFATDWCGCFCFLLDWIALSATWLSWLFFIGWGWFSTGCFCALLFANVVLQDCIVCGCKAIDCWFCGCCYHHDRTTSL